jgi:Ser/Thr protein kinase RdoA (MazF antagonist)
MSAVPVAQDSEAEFAEIARKAIQLWDVRSAGLCLLKMRENAVYRVDCESGRRLVLRVHRPGYHSDAALRSESEWISALADAGLRVPRVVLSKQGKTFERVSVSTACDARQVDVLEWIEGLQLGSVENGIAGDVTQVEKKYGVLGEIAARLHNQSAQWQSSPEFERHSWCEAGLVGDRPLWGRFWELEALDDSQRFLLETVRAALQTDLVELSKEAARFGLIHADLVPENLMIDGDDVHVIDFDDAGYGWHVFDIATSLYFLTQQDYFELARDALIKGYRRERPLPDEDLKLLPMFLAARATTYLGWVHERKHSETARELTSYLVELACAAAKKYLAAR